MIESIIAFFHTKGADLIVTIVGTALGSGFSFWLYLRQLNDARAAEGKQAAQAKQVEAKAVLQRHVDHIRWLSGILEQVIGYAANQAEQLQLFVDRLKDDPSELHRLGVVISSSVERLTRADNEATFHAYNTIFAANPNRKDDYRKLLSVLDYLAGNIAHVQNSYEKYRDLTYERREKLKDLIQQCVNSVSTLNILMSKGGTDEQHSNPDLQRYLNSSLIHYTKLIDDNNPIKNLLKAFIEPLKLQLLQYRHTPNIWAILVQLKNITLLFSDLEVESLHFISTFSPSVLNMPNIELINFREVLENGIRSFEALSKQEAG